MKLMSIFALLLAPLIQSASANSIRCFFDDPNQYASPYSAGNPYGGFLRIEYGFDGSGKAAFFWDYQSTWQKTLSLGDISVTSQYSDGTETHKITGSDLSGQVKFGSYSERAQEASFSFVDETGTVSKKRITSCDKGAGDARADD